MRWLLAMVVVAALTSCGGESLTAEERLDVAEARSNFAHLVLDGSGYGQSQESVDRLITIYRDKPNAKYDGLTMRQVLQDAASDLDGYQPEMAAELDRALG